MRATPPRFALLELHVAVLLFGLASLFGKWLTLPPSGIVLGRTAIAAAVLWLVAARTRGTGTFARLRGRTGLWLAAGGVLLAFHWMTFFQSVQVSSVAIAVISVSTYPLFLTPLEPWLFGERLRPKDFATALLGLAGVWLLTPAPSLASRDTLGVLWGLASGLAFALLTLINRHQVRSLPPAWLFAAQTTAAALTSLPFAAAQGAWPDAGQFGRLLALGVVCTAAAHTFFIRSLTHTRAQAAGVVSNLQVPWSLLFAAVWLDEVPGPRTLLGGALVVAAALWAARRDPGPRSDG